MTSALAEAEKNIKTVTDSNPEFPKRLPVSL